MAHIVVEDGDRSWIVELPGIGGRLTFGRGRSADVVLSEALASREHCAIEVRADGCWAIDLESKNGIRVNGTALPNARLQAGDRVEIGSATLTLVGEKDAVPTEVLARDPDTCLASYPWAHRRLRQLTGGAGPVMVLRIELDSLALIEDLVGVEAAAEIVSAVAREIRAAVPAQAVAASEGRGRFLVVGEGREAVAHAAAIRERVAGLTTGGPEGGVSVAVGVATADAGVRDARLLLAHAETALLEARRRGGDRVESFVPPAARPPARPADTESLPVPAKARALAVGPEGQRALALAAQVLSSDLDLDALLETALSIVVDETRAGRGVLVLREAPGELRVAAAIDRQRPGARPREVVVSHAILRSVLAGDEPLLVDDVGRDPRFMGRPSVALSGVVAALAVPIPGPEVPLGVIYLDTRTPDVRFDARALEAVAAFARLVAATIRRGLLARRAENELERARIVLARSKEGDARLRARYPEIAGRSAAILQLLGTVDRIAPTRASVLIVGESGTGKELVARAIHARSSRAASPFIAESVGALQEELLEAELFGCRKGAFTGADRDRIGIFEAAHGGTLLLDEIGDLGARTQAKLLRVLETGEVRRLGDDEPRKVDVRILAATNRDVGALLHEGVLRSDLYYRLAGMRIEVPPLRARREDIPELVELLLDRAAKGESERRPSLSKGALETLVRHDWPGNVRQLDNELRRLVALGLEIIDVAHLSPELLAEPGTGRKGGVVRDSALDDAAATVRDTVRSGQSLESVVDQLERRVIAALLAETGGHRTRVASILRLSRAGLLKKIRRYRLE